MLRSHMLAMLPGKGACKYDVCKTFFYGFGSSGPLQSTFGTYLQSRIHETSIIMTSYGSTHVSLNVIVTVICTSFLIG